MRLLLTLSAFAAFTLACAAAPEEEEEDRSDPFGDADTDADSDADADADRDDDGDGLTNAEESTLGTDPDSPDSDGDGYEDAAEVESATNPTWEWSHPYDSGDYLIGSCPNPPDMSAAGPTGVGVYDTYEWDAYQEGDVLENFSAFDRWGQEVTPYSFCGNYTLITQSAEWCGPCQDLASLMAEDMEQIRLDYPNFTYYEFLYQDNYGGDPDASVLQDWSRTYGLAGIPVVAPEDNTDAWINYLNASGGIPATLLLAPDMTVIWSAVDHPREYYLYDVTSILDAIAAYER